MEEVQVRAPFKEIKSLLGISHSPGVTKPGKPGGRSTTEGIKHTKRVPQRRETERRHLPAEKGRGAATNLPLPQKPFGDGRGGRRGASPGFHISLPPLRSRDKKRAPAGARSLTAAWYGCGVARPEGSPRGLPLITS